MVALLRRLELCGEPAVIPEITAFLLDARGRVARRAGRVIAALLEAVPNPDLVRFDVHLRQACWWFQDRWRKLATEDVERLDALGEPAVLATLCSHPNGRVRERALRLLDRERGGVELRFLLVRANDWVTPVRDVAYGAVRERLVPAYAHHFVACLVLVDRLMHVGRNDHAELVGEIVRLLGASDCGGALLDGLDNDDRRVRRLAYRVALEAESAGQAVTRGLDADDPLVRLWCARRARHAFSGDPLRDLVARMRRDPVMPVRREGMRTALAEFPDQAHEALEASLLDRSPSLREEARYYRAKRSAFDAASFYREALAQGGHRYAALCGLAETGGETDLATLERTLDDPAPKFRAAALRGVARLSPAPVDRLLAGLEDPSPKVVRLAAHLLASHDSILDGDLLWNAWERGTYRHTRRHVLWLFQEMPKWDGGPLILRATLTDHEEARAMAREATLHWLGRYNRSFVKPSRQQLEAFAQAIEAAAIPDETRATLRDIAEDW